jgi:hypothetical protein
VRTGTILLAGFLLWLVMDSTVLYHSAHVSVLGTRRRVALDVLGPIAKLARELGLQGPVAAANGALGRTAVGGFAIPTVPSTTSTTTTTLPGQRVTTTTLPPLDPTPGHKLRVLLVGDSIGTDLDYALLQDLQATGLCVVWTDDHTSTGLTRLDYYPWIAELESDVYRYRPQVIVGMMGANDSQSFVSPRVIAWPSTAWARQYARNVGQFFTIGRSAGRRMFWVSVPMIQNAGESRSWQLVRNIQEREAGRHKVVFINSDTTLDPGGTFHMYLRIGGQLALARFPSDGIHVAPAGADVLAAAVMADLRHDLHVRLR